MSAIKIAIDADNKPANFPSPEETLNQWKQRLALAKAANPKSYYATRGVSLVDASGEPYAWLKFGSIAVIIPEARTQHYIAQEVNRNADAPLRVPHVYLAFEFGSQGFIAMEYIDGAALELNDRDFADAAAAVQFLASIRGPDLVPGPIGGGIICHPFFFDHEAEVVYPTVGSLQRHILQFKYGKAAPTVDLKAEVKAHGLRLCPADPNRDNFKRDSTGKLVVLDFEENCFMPVSFFKAAFELTYDDFIGNVGLRLEFPESKYTDELITASYALVPCRSNMVGLPRELRPRRK